MPLQYIQSQKGKDLLVEDGYVSRKTKTYKDTTYWVFTDRGTCTARCTTSADEIKSGVFDHNHAASAADLDKRKRINDLKHAALSTRDSPAQISVDSTIGMPKSVAGMFPSNSLLTRTVNRTRNESSTAPLNPGCLTDLILPNDYTKTLKGEELLVFDSGQSDDRILLFSTLENLKYLCRCPQWYADGTFKVAPPLFKQLFTLHGLRSDRVLPLVYGLLPNKQEDTYVRTLQALMNVATANQISFQPTGILTDFEHAMLNGFKEVLPGAEQKGCFFHFSQAVYRHIQDFPDLLSEYNYDPDFALRLRQLSALAFVPPENVQPYFDELMGTEFFIDNEPTLRPIIDYFEDTWIGTRRRGRRRPPMFSHELWNCFERTLLQNPRTNNHVEGWNRRFNSRVGAKHPSIWKFIDKIKEKESFTQMKMEQQIAGTPVDLPRKKYRKLESRLLSVVEEYDTRSVSEYLIGISHNTAFYD